MRPQRFGRRSRLPVAGPGPGLLAAPCARSLAAAAARTGGHELPRARTRALHRPARLVLPDSFERSRNRHLPPKLSWKHVRPPACPVAMKLGDRLRIDDRVFIVRGVDPMSVTAPRVYLEDAETGERITDLLARVRAFVEDAGEQS